MLAFNRDVVKNYAEPMNTLRRTGNTENKCNRLAIGRRIKRENGEQTLFVLSLRKIYFKKKWQN
jgi:hypothetical protein